MSSTARVSSALKSRVKRASMLPKVCQPQDLLHHFPNGAYMGWSGFTGVGYPKYVSPLNCPLTASPSHGQLSKTADS